MLEIYAGRNELLGDALLNHAGNALAEDDAPLYIVVPKQLTLLTERLLLGGLKLRGSFRMRVLSPARLSALIFDEAGMPEGVRVDERGRVMLVRRAIRACENLTIYKNAERRRGFAEKCARQLELFIQGGVHSEQLRECARENTGTMRLKLNDLAEILDKYSEMTAGRYQDGETELVEAALRVQRAEFIAGSRFFFYGFDIMPPTLDRLIAGVAAHALGAELLFPLPTDAGRRDADCFRPLERGIARLEAACAEAGCGVKKAALCREDARSADLACLAGELYAYPPRSYQGKPENVFLRYARDPREECLLAAATARKMAMQGVKYAEIQLVCADLDAYRPLLNEAFRIYDVPLFLENSRPVSRMATAECLLTALRLIERNFRSEDVFTLMRTGFMALDADQADRLANYAVRRGVDGSRWLRPFTRGADAEIDEMEPLRRALTAPVLSLREKLKAALDLKGQLAAVFDFLTEINAAERSREMQQALSEGGMREAAGSLAQAWNRIIGALDQMAELMGDKKLSLRELTQTLTESLDAAVIKPLPQSGDAVYAQSAARALMQPAKVLLVLGMADQGAAAEDGLLTSAQKKELSEHAKAYLGPDERDAARIRRFYLKASLGMAQQAVYFSCALSGIDGGSQRPGLVLELIKDIFPEMHIHGGVSGDPEIERLLACAPKAASACAARGISDEREGKAAQPWDQAATAALRAAANRLPDVRDRLHRLSDLIYGKKREGLDVSSARALYGKLQTQSITRLEKFAGCPFSYYVNYGLKPDRTQPFEMTRQDTGVFLHEAVNEFLRSCGPELNDMSAENASRRMGLIADRMLEGKKIGTPMEDSACARAEGRALRATACRCAEVLAEHMRGSRFRARQLEKSFGREDGANQLRTGDTVLEGRIDRVDRWDEGNSLRVIDFKLGGRALNLAGAYHGLQLQLPVYLGAAMKQHGARSAGVYYFALDEGVIDTQTTDRDAVEAERAGKFRLNGLLPEDAELMEAQTPEPKKVFSGRFTDAGKPYANVPCADDTNFNRLVRHTLRMAQMQIDAIRSGRAEVSPAQFDQREACTICDYRATCLFDSKIDAQKVRRYKNIKWNEVFEKIAFEEDDKQKPEE